MAAGLKCVHGLYTGRCAECRARVLSARDPSHRPVVAPAPAGGSSELYFVYENWTAGPHKAVVHRGDCSHCNDGLGKDANASNRNGRWHGPFETRTRAREDALGITRNASDCSFCGGG